jgi:hypothetical protein
LQRELKEKDIKLEGKTNQVKELISAKESLKADLNEFNKKGAALEKQVIEPLKEENRILQKEKLTLEKNIEVMSGQLFSYKQKAEALEKGIAESMKTEVKHHFRLLVNYLCFKDGETQ